MKELKTYNTYLNEGIVEKVGNRLNMYIRRKLYAATALIHPIKAIKNIYVAIMNSIEDLVTNEEVKERFVIDYQDIIRMVLTGELSSAKEFAKEYNKLLEKYGYRKYSILNFGEEL